MFLIKPVTLVSFKKIIPVAKRPFHSYVKQIDFPLKNKINLSNSKQKVCPLTFVQQIASYWDNELSCVVFFGIHMLKMCFLLKCRKRKLGFLLDACMVGMDCIFFKSLDFKGSQIDYYLF